MGGASQAAQAPIRTLVVDDDFRVARVHAAFVERADGFEVAGVVHSAEQAITAIDQLRPDLVLMDVHLPDGNGIGVVRKTVKRAEHPDFIVITAARDVSTVRAAMQVGAVNYLVKPFGYEALQERLNSYLDLRRQLAALGPEADQSDVDALFGLLRGSAALAPQPPKAHSAPTIELVRNAVRAAGEDVSAAQVAEQVGVSRPTAQRYLNYLLQRGIIRLQLKYGTTGRPEHRYAFVAAPSSGLPAPTDPGAGQQ